MTLTTPTFLLTRRADEIIKDARRLSYTESYSYTEGWDNNTAVELLNLGLDRVYGICTEVDNPANIQEYVMNSVATQQAYNIPIDVQMFVRIMDVRYFYGTQPYEFVTMSQADIQDRFDFPTNIPMVYCIRNGQILFSPTPNISQVNAIKINFQKRLRSLDIRRGKIQSIISAVPTVSFQLDFTYLSQKDENMQANAASVLNYVDYCCFCDRFGNVLVNAIPISTYNLQTFVLTADPSYTIPALELAALQAALNAGTLVYVTQGKYSSTNSEIDSQCEDALIEILSNRFLSLQTDLAGQAEYLAREEQVLDRLRHQYKRYRESVFPVRWQGGNSHGSSWPFGRRGMN